MRETFKHSYEKTLQEELKRDIGKYHGDVWKASVAGSSSEGRGCRWAPGASDQLYLIGVWNEAKPHDSIPFLF